MNKELLSLLYAALAALPASMHLALAVGAPLGRFTIGGRFAGALPPRWRMLALVQAGILVAMALTMLDRSALLNLGLPEWLSRTVLGLTLLSLFANAASPSLPERLIWTPVILAMTLAAIGILAL